MRIHCIQHAAFEGPGSIGSWIERHHHTLTTTHTNLGEALPDVDAFDMLIVMGGPQSPLETDRYPYLTAEINLIKAAIKANKKIFGICLGAQLIAEAYGARTQHSPHKEIGAYPITMLPAAASDPLFKQFPKEFLVVHWHNDMPGIPKGAVLLAKSEGCPQQAVRFSERVYGVQFHFEQTLGTIKGMIENCAGDLQPGKYVQTAQELVAINFEPIIKLQDKVMDYFAELAD